MRAVVETEAAARRGEERTAARRTKVVIRRVDPWSILKFSLLFYFCLMLVFLFDLGFGGDAGFSFHGYWIFSRLFLIGLAGVIVWSLVNLLISVLYNLISDVVGGVQVTLAERR